jgi:signal transduction histidine kinase
VIALGRLMLAGLFVLAIWLELGQPAGAPLRTLIVALAYLFFSAALLLATWNDWWADAKLAGSAHTLDIAMFTILVMLTEGYTSPFFTFFMFLLLSAAIRWGWRATALTAVLVAVLYVLTGFLVVQASSAFDLQRFVTRVGYLVILSLILIWFGIHWRSRFRWREAALLEGLSPEGPPLETSLSAVMSAAGASTGSFAWKDRDSGMVDAFQVRGEHGGTVAGVPQPLTDGSVTAPFLYSLRRNRGLCRDSERSLHDLRPAAIIAPEAVQSFGLSEGLAIPVHTETGGGAVFLEQVRALSTDHLDLGIQIAAAVAAHVQNHALLRAAEDSAAARSRLSLARDLHDSVVQFLAGAAFRLEAMRRSEAAGDSIAAEIDELKKLMLEEQGELRAFVAALRSGSRIAMEDLAKDLRLLAERLSKQWSVACSFESEPGTTMIPTRLHLDAQQLIREAVANAVRHARAKKVEVRLSAEADELKLEFINDGAAYPKSADGGRMPRSLRERVEEAGGALDLSRGMGVTRISIALPISGSRP